MIICPPHPEPLTSPLFRLIIQCLEEIMLWLKGLQGAETQRSHGHYLNEKTLYTLEFSQLKTDNITFTGFF
jgi:hypothetical protein